MPTSSRTTRLRVMAIIMSLILCAFVVEVGARTYSWAIGRGFWSRPHAFESVFFVTYDWPPPSIHGDVGMFKDGQTVPRAKPARELRVIAAGGSTTVNDQNPEGLRHNQILEERFKNRIPSFDVRVLNAGGDAFSTAHTLVNFSLRLLDFEPDVLLVAHNINDLTALDYGDTLLPDYSNKYLSDTFLAFEHRQGIGGGILQMSRSLQFLRWRWNWFRVAMEYSSRRDQRHDPEQGKKLFRRNLESIVAIARQHGVRVILLTEATHRREQDDFAAYNEEIRHIGRVANVPVADADAAMSGRQELFVDPVHMSAAGVTELSDVIEPVLEATLREIVSANGGTTEDAGMR